MTNGAQLYLNLGYLPPPVAMLAGSRALEAGSWLSFDASGSERQGRWFGFAVPQPDLRGHAALEAVDAAVTSAVRRQLVSDVPVGVFLSGGIDSPLVAAKAQAFLGPESPLPAFTLGTNGGAHDESADAARYAEALGLRHVVRHITSDDVGLLDDVVGACGEPSDDYSILPTALVSRLAREEVKVVLSGDGGDDVFWGYPGRMIGPLAPPGRSLGARARGILRRSWEDPRLDHHRPGIPARHSCACTARRTAVAGRGLSDAADGLPGPRAVRVRRRRCRRLAQYLRWNSTRATCAGPAEGGPGEHARLARSEGAAP